jgi:aldose 1-epimerase
MRAGNGQTTSPIERALGAASFPMVPFCNRLDGNRFTLAGREYTLAANTDLSPHYLHGDGWLLPWELVSHSPRQTHLRLVFAAPASPYRYTANQVLSLEETAHRVALSVRNDGALPLPFGLGLHPYFPRLTGFTLQTDYQSWWESRADLIPTRQAPALGDLDFRTARPLPERAIDSGCEGWAGAATIAWNDGIGLQIGASETFGACHLYQPSAQADYFCFEPVSHITNAHNRPGMPGLALLAPGETLSGWVNYQITRST